MSVELITGTPGAGKTLFIVKKVVDVLLKTGRPIYHNVNQLNVPGDHVHYVDDDHPFGPCNWHNRTEEECKGAIFIFDEIQHQYPPRSSSSKIPPWIAAFQTHRHKGLDFYILTQDPSFIDHGVKKIVDHHYHLYRPFRFARSTLYEYQGVSSSPGPEMTFANAQKSSFVFQKKYFQFYRSSADHNMKAHPPWKLIGMTVALAVALVGMTWFLSGRLGKTFEVSGDDQDDQAAVLDNCFPQLATVGNTVYYTGITGRMKGKTSEGSTIRVDGERQFCPGVFDADLPNT